MSQLRLTCPSLPSEPQVVAFSGHEGLSLPYEIEVWFSVSENPPDPETLVDQAATLTIEPKENLLAVFDPHELAGVFSTVELLVQVEHTALYRATLAPKLYRLGLSHHSRVWTKQTPRAILEEILGSYGVEFTFETPSGTVEEHVAQYKESDLAFFSRWLERLGWVYFFRHEGGKETLVIADQATSYDVLRGSPIRYWPGALKDGSAKEAFEDFAEGARDVPGAVVHLDYDYLRPSELLQHKEPIESAGTTVWSDYGTRSFTKNEVSAHAKVLAESLAVGLHACEAKGAATRLRSGSIVSMELHPARALNREYLVVSVTHAGWEPSALSAWGDVVDFQRPDLPYFATVRLLPKEVPFRAQANTPWPRLDGLEVAFIDGPTDSQYAQLDVNGRYAIKFLFDEGTLSGGRASTQVRMAEPHGGAVEGFHFPLRKGTEVLVTFLGGDIDRPMIQSVVPNPLTKSPVTDANPTQNILHTGGGTHLTIEDQPGAEFINFFVPKNTSGLFLGTPRQDGARSRTANSAPVVAPIGPGGIPLESFGFDLRTDEGSAQVHTGVHLDVHAGAQLQIIAGAETNITLTGAVDRDVIGCSDERYHSTLTRRVVSDVTIQHDSTHDLRVLGATTHQFHDVFDMTVTGASDATFICGWNEEVTSKPSKLTYKSNRTRTIVGPQTSTISPNSKQTVHGDVSRTLFGNRSETVSGELEWDLDGMLIITSLYDTDYGDALSSTADGVTVEVLTGIKTDITVTHTESWSGPHIEFTRGAAVGATGVSVDVGAGLAIEVTLAEATATGVDISVFGAFFGIQKTGCYVDTAMVQLGLLSVTAKSGVKFL